MNREELKNRLNELKNEDVISMLLFALYKLQDIPEYSTLSELIYVLDKKNLLKFIEVFGGTTLKVPTRNELEDVVNALLLYEYINLENMPVNKATKLLDKPQVDITRIKKIYTSLSDILTNYDFKRS